MYWDLWPTYKVNSYKGCSNKHGVLNEITNIVKKDYAHLLEQS